MSATHFSITICFFLPSACIASTRFLYLCSIATRFSMNFDASRSALRMSGQIRKQSNTTTPACANTLCISFFDGLVFIDEYLGAGTMSEWRVATPSNPFPYPLCFCRGLLRLGHNRVVLVDETPERSHHPRLDLLLPL